MARSPWRDALDGQIAVLRCLRSEAAVYHLSIAAGSNTVITAYPNEQERARVQYRAGQAMAEAMEKLIREAEPVHLTRDIVEEIHRRSSRLRHREFKSQHLEDISIEPDMLPIPSGLIWFGNRGIEFSSDTPESPGALKDSVWVRAMYFGDDIGLDIRRSVTGVHIQARSPETPEKRTALGAVLFLDSERSGYRNMTQQLGPHLVPIPLVGWTYGVLLVEAMAGVAAEFDLNRTWDHGTLTLIDLTYGFLHTLFTLMLQRVTLWGGVGLSRQEQKDTEREHLRPRVQLVTWRKAHYKYPEGHIPVPVSWSCRWSVREHYRRYKSGKTVKIQSYVKGPPDKPFVLPVDRANIVKR